MYDSPKLQFFSWFEVLVIQQCKALEWLYTLQYMYQYAHCAA